MCQGGTEDAQCDELVNIDAMLSKEGRARQMAGLRKLVTAFAGVPGIIGLHGGLPPASSFPIKGVTLTLEDGRKLEIDDPVKLAAAQQYCLNTSGYAPLHQWAKKHTWQMHAPPGDHDLIITPGNNQTIEVIMRLLMDPGEAMLCEEYTYPHIAESMVQPQGYLAVPLAMDEHGILPCYFRTTLQGLRDGGKSLPKLLYTIPVGQNPTGAVTPLDRKEEIYGICRQYNILILEDDPYYYLQFSTAHGGEPKGLTDLGSSYLSMDTDGRVIRLDSFSKVLAPGLRIGWVTAAPKLVERIIYHMQGIQLGANSFTQVVVSEILNAWGPAGFERHICSMQQEYAQRAAVIQAAAEQHLAGLAEWTQPAAGMFLWLKLLVVSDADEILDKLKDAGVVVVPGRFSHCCGPKHVEQSPYVRASFASATHEELCQGMERLGATLSAAAAGPQQAAAQKSSAAAARAARLPCHEDSASDRDGHAGQRNGHFSAAAKGATAPLQKVQNGHPTGGVEGQDCAAGSIPEGLEPSASAARGIAGAHEALQGLRVSSEAARAPERLELMPDSTARVELASGSPEVTADALASQPAKTLVP